MMFISLYFGSGIIEMKKEIISYYWYDLIIIMMIGYIY